MRIAVLIKSTHFHQGYGGMETQNKLLCEGLAKKENEIVVFSPKKEMQDLEKISNGVRYLFIPCTTGKFKSLEVDRQGTWENKAQVYFRKYHQEKPFDLVIGQSSGALPLIKIKKELGLKIISICHGSKISEYLSEIKGIYSISDLAEALLDIPHVIRTFFGSQREFIHGSDALVAVSEYVKKAIREETFIEEEKVTVIHNGIDESMFPGSFTERKSDRVKIIFIGRVIKVKGIKVLLDALSSLNPDLYRLEIVGEGKDLSFFKAYCSRLDLNQQVIFHGQKSYQDAVSILNSSDIFVLPTLRVEGFPMTIVESMFSGIPSVVSDIGGNSDAIEEGKTGFLVKPGDADMLKNKLETLLTDAKLRKEMGTNARNKAQNEFTIEKMINGYETLIRKVFA